MSSKLVNNYKNKNYLKFFKNKLSSFWKVSRVRKPMKLRSLHHPHLLIDPVIGGLFAIHTSIYSLVNILFSYKLCEKETKTSCLETAFNESGNYSLNQTDADTLTFYFRIIEMVVALIPCLYFASWSDKHGRKSCFLIPFSGSILRDLGLIIATNVIDIEARWILVAAVPSGFTGSYILFLIAAFCRVSDTNDHRSRTYHFGVLIGSCTLGIAVGTLIGCHWRSMIPLYLFKTVCTSVFTLSICINVTLIILVVLFMDETVQQLGDFDGSCWRGIIAPSNLAGCLNAVFKKRTHNFRFFILILLFAFIIGRMAFYGEMAMMPKYYGTNFSWTEKTSMVFESVNGLLQAVVVLLIVATARSFYFEDASLGIVGSFGITLSSLLQALSPSFILAILGSLFGSFGALELVLPTVSTIISKGIFQASLPDYPEQIFLFFVFLTSITLLVFLYVRRNLHPELLGHIESSERIPLVEQLDIVKGEIF
ncbi:putative peptidoglycan muropeptide transporter SLC46 isoform X2 [Tachypleus tridentatus]|uniref:putative peptidoglycan muropeptide transporter SLC46 isoform X2 n=2 Tax=Tachypleus tridentatus TaxID=6853 RepID=UPI003FD4DB34